MSLPRQHNIDQLIRVNKEIKRQGGQTDRTSPSEKGLPNAMWIHDPVASHTSGKRKISTYEDFCATCDSTVKSAKKLQSKNESKQNILSLVFKNESDFEKAKIFFDEKSAFNPDDINDEFRTFDFNVDDQQEADNLEKLILKELEDNSMGRCYFESDINENKINENTDNDSPIDIMRNMKTIKNWFEYNNSPNPKKERNIITSGKYIETSKVRGYINRIENDDVYIESIDNEGIVKISLKDAIKGVKNKPGKDNTSNELPKEVKSEIIPELKDKSTVATDGKISKKIYTEKTLEIKKFSEFDVTDISENKLTDLLKISFKKLRKKIIGKEEEQKKTHLDNINLFKINDGVFIENENKKAKILHTDKETGVVVLKFDDSILQSEIKWVLP